MTLITSHNHSSIKDQQKKAMGREIADLKCRMNELTKESKRLKNDGQDPRKFMSCRNMVRMDTRVEKIDAQIARLADDIKALQGSI